MSTKVDNNSSKLTLNATMLLIEQNAYKVLLIEAYDELGEKKGRDKWLAITMTLLGASTSGLLAWLIEDIATAESLRDFPWICPKSLIYGIGTALSLVSLLIYWLTMHRAGTREKEKFIKKYMEHDSIGIITQGYQVTSSTLHSQSTNSTPMEMTDMDTNDSQSA